LFVANVQELSSRREGGVRRRTSIIYTCTSSCD